jgi:hypothetical protein
MERGFKRVRRLSGRENPGSGVKDQAGILEGPNALPMGVITMRRTA